MKLSTNNFTGFMPNGDRYKVTMETKNSDVSSHKVIHVKLYTEMEGIEKTTWVLQNNVCNVYINPKDYTKTLKKTLIDAEKAFGLQLIKSDLKIAV
tara:strand:- start:100 stop:387 length:288 start_codon:yes stop_codon:yes gene_type:complete